MAGRYHRLLTNIGSRWPTITCGWGRQRGCLRWLSEEFPTSQSLTVASTSDLQRFAAFSPPMPPSVVYSASELNLSQLPWRPAHCSGILPPADPRNLSSVFFPPAPHVTSGVSEGGCSDLWFSSFFLSLEVSFTQRGLKGWICMLTS